MKHRHDDAPLFQQPKPGKGFNFREMAATVNAKVAEQFPTNAAKAKAERDEAIRRVQDSAEVTWLAKAQEAIRACAASMETFTVDDVQARMVGTPPPREGRAMGAAMVWARRNGLIEATGDYRPSTQPQCHANPRQVWKSKVYGGPTC